MDKFNINEHCGAIVKTAKQGKQQHITWSHVTKIKVRTRPIFVHYSIIIKLLSYYSTFFYIYD